jgi:hypothetical protein
MITDIKDVTLDSKQSTAEDPLKFLVLYFGMFLEFLVLYFDMFNTEKKSKFSYNMMLYFCMKKTLKPITSC